MNERWLARSIAVRVISLSVLPLVRPFSAFSSVSRCCMQALH